MIKPKKALGQNFLQDQSVLEKIIAFAALKPDEPVLEIGPGTGNLTEPLAKTGACVLALESDPDVLVTATERLKAYPNVTLRHQNVMHMDWMEELGQVSGVRGQVSVVANIPYYITSPILEKLTEVKTFLRQAVIMMQLEVGERLLSGPGTKAYGSLSVFLQYHFEIQKGFVVPRTCFYPAPNVDSVVLKFVPRASGLGPGEVEDMVFALIRTAFWSRRKTFVNCIRSGPFIKPHLRPHVLQVFSKMGWDLRRRGETLTLAEFIGFAKAVSETN